MSLVGLPVVYRVLQNDVTAPARDYTAPAEVVEDHGDGSCTLCVFPRRSDPFQVGPVIRIDQRNPDSPDFRVWEQASPAIEGV